MGEQYLSDNSGNRVPAFANCGDPVAVSGISLTLTTAGSDYTQTLVGGQLYEVTAVVASGTVLASITGVTSTAANIEHVWPSGQNHVFRMPLGATTLYLESDVNTTLMYFRKLAG